MDLGVMGQWGRRNMGVAYGNMTFFDSAALIPYGMAWILEVAECYF